MPRGESGPRAPRGDGCAPGACAVRGELSARLRSDGSDGERIRSGLGRGESRDEVKVSSLLSIEVSFITGADSWRDAALGARLERSGRSVDVLIATTSLCESAVASYSAASRTMASAGLCARSIRYRCTRLPPCSSDSAKLWRSDASWRSRSSSTRRRVPRREEVVVIETLSSSVASPLRCRWRRAEERPEMRPDGWPAASLLRASVSSPGQPRCSHCGIQVPQALAT